MADSVGKKPPVKAVKKVSEPVFSPVVGDVSGGIGESVSPPVKNPARAPVPPDVAVLLEQVLAVMGSPTDAEGQVARSKVESALRVWRSR